MPHPGTVLSHPGTHSKKKPVPYQHGFLNSGKRCKDLLQMQFNAEALRNTLPCASDTSISELQRAPTTLASIEGQRQLARPSPQVDSTGFSW